LETVITLFVHNPKLKGSEITVEKINQLIKIRYNFFTICFISCIIYLILFLVLLVLSTPHPLVTFIIVVSAAPGCWLLVNMLFKYKTKLENYINTRLTKIIMKELQKELKSQNVCCAFNLKPVGFNGSNIADLFHFYYSDAKLYETYIIAISKTRKWIMAFLPNLYGLRIELKEDPTLNSDLVV